MNTRIIIKYQILLNSKSRQSLLIHIIKYEDKIEIWITKIYLY